MNQTAIRVLNNLRRPLPDLLAYLSAKLTSRIWAIYVRRTGRSFHICRGARIEGGSCITIGDKFYAGQSLWIAAVQRYLDFEFKPSITIGSRVTCSDFVHIAATSSVTIHDNVLIGSRVHITDHAHGSYSGEVADDPAVPPAYRRLSEGRSVVIGANVWLGDGVVVLPGVTIGEGSIVGANSVVSRDLPARVIAVGAPAMPIKSYDSLTKRWVEVNRHAKS